MGPQRSSDTPPPPQTKGFRYGRLADSIIPAVKHVTKANLIKYVNDGIRDLLVSLAPDYELAQVDPSLLKAQLCLGDTNYMDAGRYFQVVSTLRTASSVKVNYDHLFQNTAKKGPTRIKWLTKRLSEAIIMDNEELGRLLLIREELKQTGAMKNSPQKPEFGSIRFSSHYMQLYQHFYPEQSDGSAPAHPPTPPSTNSQPRIAARATLKDINSTRAPSRAPSGDSADFDWTPPPHILPSSSRKFAKSWISISDHSDIEGMSESENVKPRYGPPVLFIFWVEVNSYSSLVYFHPNRLQQDRTRFIEVVLVPEEDKPFSLSNFKIELGTRGIETSNELEVYDSEEDMWVALPWAHACSPIRIPGHLFLIRYHGVRELHGFQTIVQFASRFPKINSLMGKGKVQAL